MGLLGISKKGKWIIGGVCAFAVVATATTGLAAWVIGQNTVATEGGNITVVKDVTDESISLAITSEGKDLEVEFGPKAGDYTVVNASDRARSEEKLVFTVKGTYTKGAASSTISYVTAELELSKEAVALVKEGYIVAPGELKGTLTDGQPATYTLPDIPVTADAGENALTGTFNSDSVVDEEDAKSYAFKWGTKFGGMNPCEYYDGTTDKDYAAAKTALTALNSLTSPTTFKVTLAVK